MTLDPARRKILWIEVGVVLMLFAAPETWYAVSAYFYPNSSVGRMDWLQEVARVFQTMASVVPVLFIVWGSGDPLARFGLRSIVWWKALPACLFALLSSLLAHYFIGRIMFAWTPGLYMHSSRILHSNSSPTPSGGGLIAGRIGIFFLGAFEEEFIMRGYLIARLTELLGRPWIALLISSALFSIYHLYEGPIAVVSIFFVGVILGATLMLSRSLWPGTVAHALYNTFTLLTRLRF